MLAITAEGRRNIIAAAGRRLRLHRQTIHRRDTLRELNKIFEKMGFEWQSDQQDQGSNGKRQPRPLQNRSPNRRQNLRPGQRRKNARASRLAGRARKADSSHVLNELKGWRAS